MTTRDKWVHIKVSNDERQAWQSQAEAEGITVADLIRSRLATTTVGREPRRKRAARRADPALLAAVGRIGNNLNQLAAWANTYKRQAEVIPVIAALVALERAVREVVGLGTWERHSPGGAVPEPGHEPGYPGGPSHSFSIAPKGVSGSTGAELRRCVEEDGNEMGGPPLPSLLPNAEGQGGAGEDAC